MILNGKYIEPSARFLQQFIPGVCRLEGLFETILVVNECARDLDTHYARLCRGLKIMAIKRPWTKKCLADEVSRCSRGIHDFGRIRLMVWQGSGHTQWAIIPAEYTPPSDVQYALGVRVGFVPCLHVFRQRDGFFKSLEYKVYRDASAFAQKQGWFEALLVDKAGRIIDGARTNLLVLTDNGLLVSPAGFGTFDGLMRRRIVTIAREAGIRIFRCNIREQDLVNAREAWLTNSLVGLLPINLKGLRVI